LETRAPKDYTARYPLIVDALKDLHHDLVLDGEMIVMNQSGKPDFNAVQNYNGQHTPINYCVFDILWMGGYNLMNLPLVTRKSILALVVKNNEHILYTDSYDNGPALFAEMRHLQLEGIIAKQKDSPYIPGQRKDKWLKTPV
jgi:bifunctional non-homologous end joining protein LigD